MYRIAPVLCLLAGLIGGCRPPETGPQRPAGALPRSEPEAQGMSSAAIEAFVDALEAERLKPQSAVELHSLMIVRHGRVVAEGWWTPFEAERSHMMFSMSKSFTSTAVGFAVAEGLFSLDDPVVSFFPDALPATVSDGLAAMRVRHLITMSTGQEADGDMSPATPDWVASFLATPVVHPPGSRFRYNTSATFMLSAIVQKTSGQDLVAFLTPRLFEPLHIEGATWDASPLGIRAGGVGLKVKTEDMAKLGLLYLQGGEWEGRRLLPAEWVAAATSPQIETAEVYADTPEERAVDDWAQGYGYQFWPSTHGAFRGDGAFGQYSLVLPEQDAVVAITGASLDMQRVLDIIWEQLLPAFHDAPLPATPGSAANLHARLDALTLFPEAVTPTPAPLANGRTSTFRLDANPMQATTLTIAIDPSEARFALQDSTGEHTVRAGFGAWIEQPNTMPLSPPRSIPILSTDAPTVTAAAVWSSDATLAWHWRYPEGPYFDRVETRFAGDSIYVSFSNNLVRGAGDRRPALKGVRTDAP
ncbi:MAG: serine hydrolase [Rhodothermales bacterium]